MDNLRLFQTVAEYSAATINLPSVSWIKEDNSVRYDPYVPAYKIKAKYNDNTTYNKLCDSSTMLSKDEITGNSKPNSAMTEVEIGSCVTSIGSAIAANNSLFGYCTSLTSVTIPDSVTYICYGCFNHCTSLSSITIPNSVDTIEGHAFDGCSGLTSIEIPSGVTTINSGLFNRCSSLTSVTIPNTVTTISDSNSGIEGGAFGYCTSLSSITIPNSVTYIGYEAFRGSGLESITIPSGVTSLGNAFNGCGSLTSVTVDSNNVVYDSRNNCNAIIETSTNKLKYGCKTTTIPNTVTSIGNDAFKGVPLTDIDIPDSVTAIGNYAFSQCRSLTSCTIGSGVTTIGSYAFYDCLGLASIELPSGITSIGDYAFANCINITGATIMATTPPTLGSNAFYYGTVIYVPLESLEDYQTAWSAYNYDIQAIVQCSPSSSSYTYDEYNAMSSRTPIYGVGVHNTEDSEYETYTIMLDDSVGGYNNPYKVTFSYTCSEIDPDTATCNFFDWTYTITYMNVQIASGEGMNVNFCETLGFPLYVSNREDAQPNRYVCDEYDPEDPESCISGHQAYVMSYLL